MGYLVKIGNEKNQIIKPKSFKKEEILQEIVKNNPEIIPLEEIDENFDPLLIIGREFTLENVGSIDVLAIDVTGLITIIEFKLEKNTDIRKAVAQVVEYAANIWEMSYDVFDKKVQNYFNSGHCEISDLKTKTLVKAVRWHFNRSKKEEGVEFSSEEFIKNVSSNLQKGEFRMIVFCDHVDERIKRSVEYLNLLSRFDIYCASTDAYIVDGVQLFRSSLITRDRKKASSVSKYAGKITYDDFINSVPDSYKNAFKFFNEGIKQVEGYYSWGSKGFAWYFVKNEDKFRPFEAFPGYIIIFVKMYFDRLIKKDIKSISEESVKDYSNRIEKIKTFQNLFHLKNYYKNFKYSQMKPEELREYFEILINWYKKCF